MEKDSHEIRQFTKADFLPALDTLVSAFAEDPVAKHLFPDSTKRPAGMKHIFRMGLRHGLRHGHVDVIDHAGAVAIWIKPPHTTASWRQLLLAGFLATPFIAGWNATRRMLRYERFIETCRLRSVKVPHWYLFSIGVNPQLQGRGLGATLLRAGMHRARATQIPCYLETSNALNLPFYERHGFRMANSGQLPGTDLKVWSLVAGETG